MRGKMKVWGGVFMTSYGAARGIVSASSQKRAAELLGVSLNYFRLFWCETGNETELKIAREGEPETIWVEIDRHMKNFRKYKPGGFD